MYLVIAWAAMALAYTLSGSRRTMFRSNSVPRFVSSIRWFWISNRKSLAKVHPISSFDRSLHDGHRGAILVNTNQCGLVSELGNVLESQFHHFSLACLLNSGAHSDTRVVGTLQQTPILTQGRVLSFDVPGYSAGGIGRIETRGQGHSIFTWQLLALALPQTLTVKVVRQSLLVGGYNLNVVMSSW